MQLWLRVLHIIGVVFWIGGSVTVGLLGAAAAQNKDALKAARGTALKVATPGMILAWLGGLVMFGVSISVYAKAGWMHGKITLALVAAGLTGVLSGKLRKAAAGEEVSASTLRNLSIGILVIAILNIVLAKFGNVWMPAAVG